MSGKGGLEDNRADNLFIMQLDNFERRILILKVSHGSGTGSRVMLVLDPWRDRYDDW